MNIHANKTTPAPSPIIKSVCEFISGGIIGGLLFNIVSLLALKSTLSLSLGVALTMKILIWKIM